jgi:hypothetical protein
MGIVVLGVSGVKLAGEDVFRYFGGGELKTTDLGSRMGCTPQRIPTFTIFEA